METVRGVMPIKGKRLQASGAGVPVKTAAQERREKRDAELAGEYLRLISENPGRAVGPLREYLMERYGFDSLSGYYAALKRGIAAARMTGGKQV